MTYLGTRGRRASRAKSRECHHIAISDGVGGRVGGGGGRSKSIQLMLGTTCVPRFRRSVLVPGNIISAAAGAAGAANASLFVPFGMNILAIRLFFHA